MAFEKFKGKKFSEIKAQITSKRGEPYKNIPAALRLGIKSKKHGGFFDYDLILSASDKNAGSPLYEDNAIHVERDEETGDLFVGIPEPIFEGTMLGVFNRKLSTSASAQVSSSFFEKTDGLGFACKQIPLAERKIGILVKTNEPGSSDDTSSIGIIPPPTASVNVFESPGLGLDLAGSGRERRLIIHNTSSHFFSTTFKFAFSDIDKFQASQSADLVSVGSSSLTRSFDPDGFHYVQPIPISHTVISMSNSNTTSSFFAVSSSFSSSQDFGVVPGTLIGKDNENIGTRAVYYNGQNNKDGKYSTTNFKGFVIGEGFTGEGEVSESHRNFLPQNEFVWYSQSYSPAMIASASFYYYPYPSEYMENTSDIQEATINNVISASILAEAGDVSNKIDVFWLKHSYSGSWRADFDFISADNLASHSLVGNNQPQFYYPLHQLPYMPAMGGNDPLTVSSADAGKAFGQDGVMQSGSHLWTDTFLSKPAPEGYYIHSQSVALKNQGNGSWKTTMINNIANSISANANFTASLITYGVFKNISPSRFINDTTNLPKLNTSSSQHRTNAISSGVTQNICPRISSVFLHTSGNVFNPYKVFRVLPHTSETGLI